MSIIAIANFKGGSGKTSLTLNLGYALREAGRRVLMLDADPQASLTVLAGVQFKDVRYGLYEAITEYRQSFEASLGAALWELGPGLDLIPTTPRLNLVHDDLVGALRREEMLRGLLASVAGGYDIVLIDNMPYMGVLPDNAFVAADAVLVPMPPEFMAIESFKLLVDRVTLMRRSHLNDRLRILGIAITRARPTQNIHSEAITYLRDNYRGTIPVFDTVIKEAVIVQEAAALRQSVLQYKPRSEAAEAFRLLAQEVWDAQA